VDYLLIIKYFEDFKIKNNYNTIILK
jgi:hypothetical protein